MSISITGTDKLQKTLEDAQQVLSELGGTVAELSFNPGDPASVAAAVAEMERAVDAKLLPYQGNPILDALATKSKEEFRRAIEDRAAAAQA